MMRAAGLDAAALHVERIALACAQRGIRLTPLRLKLVHLLAAAPRPLKAYALLDRLRECHRGAEPPTVYRALDFLRANDLVHKLPMSDRFVLCRHPEEAHGASLFVCTRCSDATEIEATEIDAWVKAVGQRLHFVPATRVLEVAGICAACSRESEP